MSIHNKIRAEVVPEVVFLGKLIERIISGKIRIPNFQRPFVWKQQDIHVLLDSVFQGFPIGTILIWETENKDIESVESVGPLDVGPRPAGHVGYLLDGQQRITALVGTLKLPNEHPPIKDQIDWRIFFDLEKSEFIRNPKAGNMAQYFPMANLLDTSGFIEAARKIEDIGNEQRRQQWLNAADHLANAFRDYQLPLIRIREADLDSAVTVFARLNRKGRKIAADEMVSALTYRPNEFHLAEHLNNFIKDELTERNFGNLKRIFLLRAVLAALGLDIYAKDWAVVMVKPEVRERLPESFEAATRGLKLALKFLKKLGVKSDQLLPYGLQLVLLGEFYRLCPDPKPAVCDLLRRWFWVTSFTGWFGTASTSKVTHALHEIRALADGTGSGFSVINLDEKALPFPERFDSRSARARTFLLYLASLQPLSLVTQEKLELGKLLSTLGASAIGYIWHSPSEARHFSSVPANRIFLNGDVRNVFEHLKSLDEKMLHKVLPSHGFPGESIEALHDNDHRKFIQSRENNLIEGERDFMKTWRVNLPENRIAETVADSDASDTDNQPE